MPPYFAASSGSERIHLKAFSNLSSRVSIYSARDDFSAAAMTNPTVPPEFTNVIAAPVQVGRHVVVGSGSVVLPDRSVADGGSCHWLPLAC